MKSNELREKFLEYFKEKGHKVIPSASLVPENDPSVLFTTAGMHPLVPYLMGESHPLGNRLVDVQKCLRTDDIDEVGDSQHLTFFEMLGYWSLGDYFKKESIIYTFGFYTEVLGFNKDDISVTVFAGDDNAPFDEESYNTWKNEIGIPKNRIYKYPKKENWWGPVSLTGPCGPCTEMFIDTGTKACGDNCGPSCHCDKFVEIGNNVFMEFFKTKDGQYEKLKQKNVDVGLGFERLVMFSQGKKSVFEIDIFLPIIKEIEKMSGLEYGDKTDEEYIQEGKQCWVDVRKEFRIIADHIKAAVFAIADGVCPSNKGAGYVVRRLIRRAVVKANQLGIKDNFTAQLADIVFGIYENVYFDALISANSSVIPASQSVIPAKAGIQETIGIDSGSQVTGRNDKGLEDDKGSRKNDIKMELEKEEVKFKKTLREGLKIIAEQKEVSGKILFDLYQSFGLPLEISTEEFKSRGIEINNSIIEQFNTELKAHQELSRTASAGMFKGGLAESGEMATKYHTASHLLLSALQKIVDPNIIQRGSNITAERLRLDFNSSEKLTPEQIKEVEDLVNEQIKKDLPVLLEEMTLTEAKNSGAKGIFDSKYGERVKVYTIGDAAAPFSREICGGPHVEHLGVLGQFRIKKEESSSSGVRRIKAVSE